MMQKQLVISIKKQDLYNIIKFGIQPYEKEILME